MICNGQLAYRVNKVYYGENFVGIHLPLLCVRLFVCLFVSCYCGDVKMTER